MFKVPGTYNSIDGLTYLPYKSTIMHNIYIYVQNLIVQAHLPILQVTKFSISAWAAALAAPIQSCSLQIHYEGDQKA